MKTKQRIINQAILSYNESGLSNVTSRDMAKSLNMSHGNLEYHFPNKEAILVAIYAQMKEEASRFYIGVDMDVSDPIEHLHYLLLQLEEFQDKYHFFCIDIIEICRKYGKVNQDLENNMRIRKTQMADFFNRFLASGYMEQEAIKYTYERLQHSIRIMITFWKPQELVMTHFDLNQKGEMVKHIWGLLIPYFTEKGLKKYKQVIQQQKLQLVPER